MTPFQSTINLKVKEKKESISGFIPLWFTGSAKVSVHSDWQQIQIYYQHISIVNRVFSCSSSFFFENGLIKTWWNYFLFPLIFCSAIHGESHMHTKHASETAHRLLHDGAGSILNHNSVPKNAIPSLCGSTRGSLALTTAHLHEWEEQNTANILQYNAVQYIYMYDCFLPYDTTMVNVSKKQSN